MIAALAAIFSLFRFHRTPAGRSFALGMGLLAVESYFLAVSIYSPGISIADFLVRQRLRLLILSFVPAVWLFFSLVYSRGDHRFFVLKWRTALVAAGLLPVLVCLIGFQSLIEARQIPEEFSFEFNLGWSGQTLFILLIAASVAIIMNFEQTFRATVGTKRWQIKLVLIGLGTLFVVRIFTASQALLYRNVSPAMENLNQLALIVACLLVAVSVIRTKGFSIDVYPSQRMLYRSVTVVLIGGYLVIVGILARIANWIGSGISFQIQSFVILIGLVVLALLLLSDRLRTRLEIWVSRHFKRPRYNYRSLWISFTEKTVNCVDERQLGRALAGWISETLNSLSVSVWCVVPESQRVKLVGSTLSLDADKVGHHFENTTHKQILEALDRLDEMADLDSRELSPELNPLKHLQPDIFEKGGHRLAIPLIAGNAKLGVIVVGDRISGIPYSEEDCELLSTVGGQGASLLEGIRLSQKFVDAKEMEAFQNMSTFFVHDLKNTVSTLSLMLQNLPRHFDNPEFREDALRSIQKSVDHINRMIQQLSAIREKLDIKLREVELSELVSECAGSIAKQRGIVLKTDWRPAGKVMADDQQLDRVITNLLVNASEASPENGRIEVRTGRDGDCAYFSVKDEGCGMSGDYIQNRLFRPFQTTKRQGTGIGLYHSKMIVDAHQGKMEVSSTVGKGTEIRVYLPLKSES